MKKVFALVFIVGVCLGVWFGFNNNKKENGKLFDLGFTKEEVTDISKTFNEESIDKLISLESKDMIKEMINADSFDKDKLDAYLAYYQKNKSMKLSNVVKLVNNNIDKIKDLEYDDVILSLVDEDYYIYDNTARYVDYYKDNSDLSAKDIVTNVNSNLDYEFYTNVEATDMSKGNLIIVNKYYYLDKNYEPEDLVYIEGYYSSWPGAYMKKEAYEHFKEMVDAAREDGIKLWSQSPYRSYQTQLSIYNRYVSRAGQAEADTYSARAGYSEHQTGLAVDINEVDESFAYTKEYQWLINNSYKYGFILRYPEGKEYITGYQYEPWHYRYIGVEDAKKIYNLDITYEEYYAYYIK